MLSGLIICHKEATRRGGGGQGNYTSETAVIIHSRWWFCVGTKLAKVDILFSSHKASRGKCSRANKLHNTTFPVVIHMIYTVHIYSDEKNRIQWLKESQLLTSDTFCALWQKLDEAVCSTSKPTCVCIVAVQIGQLISSGICMHPGRLEATQCTRSCFEFPELGGAHI